MTSDNAVTGTNFFDKLREYAHDATFVDEEANRLVQLFDRITGYHESKATDNPDKDTRHLNPTGTFVSGVNSPMPQDTEEEDNVTAPMQRSDTVPPNATPVDVSGGTVIPQDTPVQANDNPSGDTVSGDVSGNVTFQPATKATDDPTEGNNS